MTGRRLYEKYTDALAAAKVTRWDPSTRRNVRWFPVDIPLAWGFLPERERDVWNMCARLVTPRKRKVMA